jgi:hypothetical protein
MVNIIIKFTIEITILATVNIESLVKELDNAVVVEKSALGGDDIVVVVVIDSLGADAVSCADLACTMGGMLGGSGDNDLDEGLPGGESVGVGGSGG